MDEWKDGFTYVGPARQAAGPARQAAGTWYGGPRPRQPGLGASELSLRASQPYQMDYGWTKGQTDVIIIVSVWKYQ